jgi:hypothetical protein
MKDINPDAGFDFNSPSIRILGHLLSLLARVAVHCTEACQKWLQENNKHLCKALHYMASQWSGSSAEALLEEKNLERLRKEFQPKLEAAVQDVVERTKEDDELDQRLQRHDEISEKRQNHRGLATGGVQAAECEDDAPGGSDELMGDD